MKIHHIKYNKGKCFCPTPPKPEITFPRSGYITNAVPVIRGMAQPYNMVRVCLDCICYTVEADDMGNWCLKLDQPLESGEHVVTAVQINYCCKKSCPDIVKFNVHPTPICPEPDAPIIIYPVNGQVVSTPLFTIEGTAEPNAILFVSVDEENYTVTANETGEWSLTLSTPLVDGTYEISAIQENDCGNTSPPAISIFTVEIPVCPIPDPPIITVPASEEIVYDEQPYIAGSAEPGNTVTVCVDGICTVTQADENGEWSIQAREALEIGTHTVTARQQNDCGKTSDTVSHSFVVAIPVNELTIIDLTRGQSFKTVDATLRIGMMTGPWTVYYLLLDPSLPVPTEEEVIGYDDAATLINGQAARGIFVQPYLSNVTIQRILPGREVPDPLPDETGVVDGQRYILYMVGVVSPGVTTGLVYSPVTAIGMPFDSGNGTISDPFIIRELTSAELELYPDLIAGHSANRAGVNETARQLDNIEGMRVLYDQNTQNGIADSLSLVYTLSSNFDLSGYTDAYGGSGWRPIGNYDGTYYIPNAEAHIFSGSLLGNFHTITNPSLTPAGITGVRWVQFVGFIGFALGATVQDLAIRQAVINPVPVLLAASGYVLREAVFCAYAKNCSLIGLIVSSSSLTASFGANAATYIEAGGIAGELIGGIVQDILIDILTLSDSSSIYDYFGGVGGYVHNDSNSQTFHNVSLSNVSCMNFNGTTMYAGGMFGYCSAVNSILIDTVSASNTQIQTSRSHSGGVIGYLRVSANVEIQAISVTEPVISSQVSGYYTGGIIGYMQVAQSLTIDDVTVSAANIAAYYGAAGMVGWTTVQNGAAIDIGNFTVSGNIQVTSSYGGGAMGQIDRYQTSSLYIHDGQVLSGSTITATNNSGGLIGDLIHTTENNFAYIRNCQSAADVTGTGTNLGGLCGFCNITAIASCSSSGRVIGTNSLAGGLLGSGGPIYIVDCHTTSEVTGGVFVGGFIGSVTTGNVLAPVNPPFSATANLIERSSVRSSLVSSTGEYVGGFSGRSIGMTYDQCFTLASVSAQANAHAGGFIGIMLIPNPGLENGLVQNCYAVGSVNGTGNMYGGLIGENRHPVLNSYSAGTSVSGGNMVGGIAGACTQPAGTITACLALGDTVSAQNNLAGRIVGTNSGSAILQRNYAINTLVLIKNGIPATPVVNPFGIDGGTVTVANLPSTIESIGWNTSTIWDLSTIATLGRPTLMQNSE